ADPSQAILYPGATVSISGSRLAAVPNSAQVTLSGQSVQVLSSSATQVNFVIPPNFATGLAVLTLNNGSSTAPSLEIEIDNPPPVIQQVATASGQVLDSTHSASAGDVLTLTVTNVDPGVTSNPSRVDVTVSGLEMPVLQVMPGAQRGTVTVSFVVSQS